MAHILIIEENPRDYQMLQLMLAFAQHESDLVADSRHAYERMEAGMLPDAVIANVMMETMDGFMLCRKIRQNPDLAHIPVVLLAPSYSDETVHQLAQRAGASALLTKPLQRDQFLAELDRVMMLSPYQTRPLSVASPHEEAAYLRDYSAWLSQMLYNSSLRLELAHDALDLQNAHVNAINSITTSLGGSLDIDEITRILVRKTAEITRAQAVAIYEQTEPDCFVLRRVAGAGIPTPHMIPEYLMGASSPLRPLHEMANGLLFNNPHELSLLRDLLELDIDPASMIISPLVSQGDLSGFMVVMRTEVDQPYTRHDADMLLSMAGAVGLALRNAHLFKDIEKAYAELQDLDRRKSEFVAITSHELRTPIAIMLGYAGLLHEDETDPDKRKQLGMIERQANFLAGMVDILINIYELQQTNYLMQLKCKTVRLDKLLEEALDMTWRRSNYTRSVDVQLDKDPVEVVGDEVRLLLALHSLLDNAIKFSNDGGLVRVMIASRPDGGVVITVEDQGIGIPEEQLEHIFEPFYQIESSLIRRYGGMGLGLALVRGIVEIHGGSVEIKSRVKQGTRIIVTLPPAPPPERCIR